MSEASTCTFADVASISLVAAYSRGGHQRVRGGTDAPSGTALWAVTLDMFDMFGGSDISATRSSGSEYRGLAAAVDGTSATSHEPR